MNNLQSIADFVNKKESELFSSIATRNDEANRKLSETDIHYRPAALGQDRARDPPGTPPAG